MTKLSVPSLPVMLLDVPLLATVPPPALQGHGKRLKNWVGRPARLLPLVLLSALAGGGGRVAMAQQGSLAAAVGFDYGRANLVQGCNCFNLYGGSAEVQFGVARHLFVLGDVTGERQSGLTPDGYSLTQTTYMGGVRYGPLSPQHRMQPFADLLMGAAHASGSLSPANTGYGGANAFAAQLGGGLGVHLGRRLVFVPLQAEYLLTRFANGGSNQQNQLRFSAGVLVKLRR